MIPLRVVKNDNGECNCKQCDCKHEEVKIPFIFRGIGIVSAVGLALFVPISFLYIVSALIYIVRHGFPL